MARASVFGADAHFLRAEAHGAALAGAVVALLLALRGVLPFGDQRDHRMRGGAVELGAVGVLEPEHVAAVFDDRELHAEADAEVRNLVLAREAHGGDLAFDAALAEAAGHEDGVHARERMRAVLLDVRGFDVVHIDASSWSSRRRGSAPRSARCSCPSPARTCRPWRCRPGRRGSPSRPRPASTR